MDQNKHTESYLQPKNYFINLFRPWKVVTFLIALGFLIWGAYAYKIPTWDVPISIIMSVLCFLLSPYAVSLGVSAVTQRKSGWLVKLAISIMLIYFVGSGSYEIYNTLKLGQHPDTYWVNLSFSVPVAIVAGLVWRYPGSLADLYREVLASIGR